MSDMWKVDQKTPDSDQGVARDDRNWSCLHGFLRMVRSVQLQHDHWIIVSMNMILSVWVCLKIVYP